MSTSGNHRTAAVVAARALSRRHRNAVLAHTETLVDLGDRVPGEPIADTRDFERYHMAWFARQALTGIAPPELLHDVWGNEPTAQHKTAPRPRLLSVDEGLAPGPVRPLALRSSLLSWLLPVLLVLSCSIAVVLNAEAVSISLAVVLVIVAAISLLAAEGHATALHRHRYRRPQAASDGVAVEGPAIDRAHAAVAEHWLNDTATRTRPRLLLLVALVVAGSLLEVPLVITTILLVGAMAVHYDRAAAIRNVRPLLGLNESRWAPAKAEADLIRHYRDGCAAAASVFIPDRISVTAHNSITAPDLAVRVLVATVTPVVPARSPHSGERLIPHRDLLLPRGEVALPAVAALV